MTDEIAQKLWLGLAAIGGGMMSEGIRRLIVSADKVVDFKVQKEEIQLKREEAIAAKERELRQALWEELERMMRKVENLEKRLTQATEIIEALNTSNRKLTKEVADLSSQLTKFTSEMRDEI